MVETQTFCGYIALIGRPNVGKSTLLNRIIGQKLSITSRKPQTTRHRLLGIKTQGDYQFVYVDTPGLHLPEQKKALNIAMNRAASFAIKDVDVIIFLVDALKWTEEDQFVVDKLSTVTLPIIIAINKVDEIKDKQKLLPIIEKLNTRLNPKLIIPISAQEGDNISELEQEIKNLLPASPHFFPSDDITDKNQRFLVAELIREKLFRMTGEELPYSSAIQIEEFKDKGHIILISALILVEREGQKRIIIGKQGSKLKQIGKAARIDIESLLGKKVFLQLWIKVKSGWSDDERAIKSLGYSDD